MFSQNHEKLHYHFMNLWTFDRVLLLCGHINGFQIIGPCTTKETPLETNNLDLSLSVKEGKHTKFKTLDFYITEFNKNHNKTLINYIVLH